MKFLNNIITTTSDTPNVTTGQVSTTDEQAAFPRSNLLDVNQAKVWKPTASITGQIVLTIPEGFPQSASFFVGATNALTIDWSATGIISGSESGSWELYNSLHEMMLSESFIPMSTMFIELTGLEGDVTVTLDFNTGLTGIDDLEVGIVQAGWVKTFADITYGLSENLNDNNIYRRLSNGAQYIKERIPARVLSGKSMIHFGDMDLFSSYVKKVRVTPYVIILTNLERRALLFGRFRSTPRISRTLPEHHEIQIEVEEIL